MQHSARAQCHTVPAQLLHSSLANQHQPGCRLVCTTPANDAALPNCTRDILLVYQLLNDESGVFVCIYLCICLCICVILGEVL